MLTITCCALLALGTAPQAAPAAPADVSITVYSSASPGSFDPQRFIEQQRAGWDPQTIWGVPGFGVVRERRRMTMPGGTGWVSFTDVAQFLDPTTVSFSDLDNPTARVLEQRMEFDLVNGAKLLEKYIDKEISMRVPAGDSIAVESGVLLSVNGGQAVLRTEQGITIVPTQGATVELASLPEGLRTRPTLLWNVADSKGGDHAVRIDYMTGGLTWRADYNLMMAADEKTASLAAWVSLLNVSGAGWKNAELRLIAGTVRRAQPRMAYDHYAGNAQFRTKAASFEEEAFGEYHRYTLGFRVDLPANSTQQLTLFPTVANVPVRKELVLSAQPRDGFREQPNLNPSDDAATTIPVAVWVIVENTEAANLGIPLPGGKVRVSLADAAGSSEFIGEDLIGHTARNGTLRLNIGDSFDVTGTRTVKNFTVNHAQRTAAETVTIVLKNGKKTAQDVTVRDILWRWSGWKITDSTLDGKPIDLTKVNSNTVEHAVTVPADGNTTLEYTVRYGW